MVFSSPVFLFAFLPLVLVAFFLTPRALRGALLVCASLLFYAFGETFYVAFLAGSIAVNYALGLLLARAATERGRRLTVALAVAANLGALAYFKYARFALANLAWIAAKLGLPALPALSPHLPIGISFITFEAISYQVDVYRGTIGVQRNPLRVAFFLSFFPHLIAGPVLRFRNVSGPLARPTVGLALFDAGVRRFILGLAKKVLVANTVARVADGIFALPAAELGLGAAWLGAACYAVQIYFDFSGYTDMAIGLGRMFGFELPPNFHRPYAATSIQDFWRRWHITLSSWFRDYLYIPLGGNRTTPLRQVRNLLTVFLLCGLWHGASWNFVAWGAFHGGFLALERTRFGAALRAAPRPLRHGYAMLVVLVGWVLFRSETMPQAWGFLRAMAGAGVAGPGARAAWRNLVDGELALTLVLAIPLATLPIGAWLERLRARLGRSAWSAFACELTAAASQVALFVASVAYLAGGTFHPFIYYRF